MASYLASLFGPSAITVDGLNIFRGLDQAPAGVFAPLADVDDNLPKAFLSYILFDKNMIPLSFNQVQVSTAAQIPTGTPAEIAAHQHERLALDNIKIEKEGFIYIYVSNQSDQNMDVYFDDLLIKHEFSDVVAGGDYYPFGLAIEDRQITREKYRYGYQGQNAEKDEETGWNHFELRDYDPVIGRWISKDPKDQCFSPYVGMGNNPISKVDPDGGWIKYSGTRAERREMRQLYREMRRNSDDFKRADNTLRFSFKRHDREAVPDRTNFNAFEANQERFYSNPFEPESMDAKVYNLKISVMYTGNAGVINTGNRKTTTFIPLSYYRNNPQAPAPISARGLLPILAHELNHSYNHHIGYFPNGGKGYESMAVDFQNSVMQQIGNSKGVKYEVRKKY